MPENEAKVLFLVLSRKLIRALRDDTQKACEGGQRFLFCAGVISRIFLSSKIILRDESVA